MQRLLTLIAAVVAVVVAVALPAAYSLQSYRAENSILQTEAQINARLVTEVVAGGAGWQVSPALRALLAQRSVDRTPEARAVHHASGALLAESRDTVLPPVLRASAAVTGPAGESATLSIERSLRPMAIECAWVALIGLVLGALVFVSLRILPMRALRRTVDLLVQERELTRETRLALRTAETRELQEQSRAAGEIARERVILASLIDSLPEPLSYKDPSGRYLGCNEAYARALGHRVDEVVGRTDAELLSPQRAALVQTRDRDLMRTLKPQYFEEWLPMADGRRMWAQIVKAPIWDREGQLVGLLGIARDMTARKKADEDMQQARELAADAARMKAHFMGSISHEIRTPMNAIIGLSHVMLKTSLTPRQRDLMQKVESSGQHLMAVIDGILDFSRVEAGKLNIERSSFELENLMDGLTRHIGEKSGDKGLELVFKIAPDVPQVLVGDARRLGQVLANFTDNAIKFTDHGEVVVSVAVQHRKDDLATLRFSVQDTGVGLSPERTRQIAESFHQADAVSLGGPSGAGIGLAVSGKLVRLMGGQAGVESQLASGSLFWFTVPLGMATGLAPAPAGNTALQGRRVLVVDDSDVARTVMLGLLQAMTFSATGVSSGRGAVATVQKAAAAGDPYEIVYIDWQMPEMNGLDTARQIMALDMASRPLIIMVTAYGREEMRRDAAFIGVHDVLVKPVSPSALFRGTMSALGSRRVAQLPVPELHDGKVVLAALRGARVLLVEDNDINQIVASEILTDAGLVVDIAADGRAALEMVQFSAYDVVLMDMEMPIMDGIEATREIRKIERLARLPIVAMTANAMEQDRQRCLEAGMNDFISKPISPAHLWKVLLQCTRQPVAGTPTTSR